MEILDHAGGAVDLSRLNTVGVVLFNHNPDKVVGKVIRAWVENNRGMAEIEFDSDDDAEKIFSKVAAGTCMIARKWTPLEVSVASVPADATVGVGRSNADPPDLSMYERQIQINKNKMEVRA